MLVVERWVPGPERSIPDGLFHSLPTKNMSCIISPILQMRKLRLREVTSLTQSWRAGKRQSWDLNLGNPSASSPLLRLARDRPIPCGSLNGS